MTDRTTWESIRLEGAQVMDQLKRMLHEGNIRRIVIKQGPKTIAEFPLTVGVVGALLAPVLAAIGALVAVLTDCSLEVERSTDPSPDKPESDAPPPSLPPA